MLENARMSRSQKQLPIAGNTTAGSEKIDKRLWNRSFRKAVRNKIVGADDFHAITLPQSIRKETEVWKGLR